MAQLIVHNIKDISDRLKGEKILLVHGRVYDGLEMKKYLNTIPHKEFTGFTSNPLYEQVCEGIRLFNDNHCSMIIAAGGGSAIWLLSYLLS